MNQLSVVAIVLLGLVGSAHMQAATDQMQQANNLMPQNNPLAPVSGLLNGLPLNNLLGGGGGSGGQQQQQLGQNGMMPQQFMQQQQQPGNLLGNLLGGLNGRLQQQQQQQQQMPLPQMQGNGIGDSNGNSNSMLSGLLRQLPQQGMQMINNLLSSVRNMLPGLGRNQQTPWNQMGQNQNQNQNRNQTPNMNQNQMGLGGPFGGMNSAANNGAAGAGGQLMGPGGALDLTNGVQGLTRPLTDALSQGRLPDMNQVTGELSKTANNLSQGLTRSLSNTITPSGSSQQIPMQQMQPMPSNSQMMN